ncbi:MAG: hypothetical protein HDQ88_09730 [Clostridia bacterium]|nr:hypothetical protein [Clostridia bacterium]
MTEDQKKLMPYVETRVESVITEKESCNIRPLIATENEIVANVRGDVLECMRELYRQEKYTPTNTLNHPALMKKEND